jgi:cytoskeletal protein CcmA (bactofilin family)
MTEPLQAFLDSGTSFQGKISFSGVVRIDGHFQGDITAEGTLVIGETGRVEANLEVGTLVVQGAVIGDVKAKERVEVGASGEIEGSVETPVLKVAEGARLLAKVAMADAALGSEARAPAKSREAPKLEESPGEGAG